MSTPFPGCAGHREVSTELRALATAVLDRVEPALDRLRDHASAPPSGAPPSGAPAAGGSPAPPCAVCPVCALVTVLRGERPELVARLAEHVSGLVVLARDALADTAPPSSSSSSSSSSERTASGSPKRVQRIPVERPTGPVSRERLGAGG